MICCGKILRISCMNRRDGRGSTENDTDQIRDCLINAVFSERREELPNGLHTHLYKDFDREGVDISCVTKYENSPSLMCVTVFR